MKTRMTLLLIFSWISVAIVHAAESQPPTSDVSVRVFTSADVNIPQMEPGEWQTLPFNSERWDTANLHETETNASRLKAPVAGKYYIFANVTWESPVGTGAWGLRLQVSGKTVIAEQTQPSTGSPWRTSMSVGTLYALAAGDYVEVQVFQNTGGALVVRQIPATSPEFGMARIP